MTLNGDIGAPHTPLALLDAKLRRDSPLRRAPGFHPHAGQRRGLVPFVGSPDPKASTVLVRSVRYGGPTATQRQAPKDPPVALRRARPAGRSGGRGFRWARTWTLCTSEFPGTDKPVAASPSRGRALVHTSSVYATTIAAGLLMVRPVATAPARASRKSTVTRPLAGQIRRQNAQDHRR